MAGVACAVLNAAARLPATEPLSDTRPATTPSIPAAENMANVSTVFESVASASSALIVSRPYSSKADSTSTLVKGLAKEVLLAATKVLKPAKKDASTFSTFNSS